MKTIKSLWLEIVFAILITIVIVLSVGNSVKSIPIDYGKRLEQSDVVFGNRNMADYIAQIKSFGDCTAIFTVKDIQGYSMLQEEADALQSLGFDQAAVLLNHEYHSFIGIWSAGEVIYQCVGGDEAITYGKDINAHYVYAKSATLNTGNTGDICIDDVQYSVNGRGFNIVTINNEGFKLIDSIAYDVHAEDAPIYRLVDGTITFIMSTREN